MECININQGSDKGLAILSSDVFKNIAQIATSKVVNVYPAKKEDDFVLCKIKDDSVTLTLSIKLKQGTDVSKVCGRLQQKIHEDILEMTGVECNEIDLDIQGFVTDTK